MNRIQFLTESCVMRRSQVKRPQAVADDVPTVNLEEDISSDEDASSDVRQVRRKTDSDDSSPFTGVTDAMRSIEKARTFLRKPTGREEQRTASVSSKSIITVLQGYRDQADRLSATINEQNEKISYLEDNNRKFNSAAEELQRTLELQLNENRFLLSENKSLLSRLENTERSIEDHRSNITSLMALSEEQKKDLATSKVSISRQQSDIKGLSEALDLAIGALNDCMKPKYLQKALSEAQENQRRGVSAVPPAELKEILDVLATTSKMSGLEAWSKLISTFEWADHIMLGDLVASFGTEKQRSDISEILTVQLT